MTFRTLAPYSAKIRPIVGPAMIRHSSRTLIPCNNVEELGEEGGRGTGEVTVSSEVTVHVGVLKDETPCICN